MPSLSPEALTELAADLERFGLLDENVLKKEIERRATERKREFARKGLLEFAATIDVPGRPIEDEEDAGSAWTSKEYKPVETTLAAHHKLLLAALQKTSETKHGRLMVFMPPGSAKSTYASVVFPSWYLGSNPGRRVILASYGDDLARKMGRRTRTIIRQRTYREIFKANLTRDSQAAQEFGLTNGSEYMACGLIAGITGNRAHGIIIDDPIKGREAANSDAIRDKTWDAYEDDLKTRLVPGGWIVLIQTRWHQDDLAGRILPDDWHGESGEIKCKDGNTWTIICLQARCEVENDPLGRSRGDYLWPEWFDRKHWAQYETNLRTWASLYQQLPSPDEGDLFHVDQISTIDAIPTGRIQWVRGWDLGATTDGNYTAGGRLGLHADGYLIIADMVRMQRGPEERDAAILNTARADGLGTKVDLPQDPGQAGKSQIAYLTKKLMGFAVFSSPESGDKVVRAEPFAAQVNVGNVKMLRGPWNKDLKDEMRLFPNGTYDDQVDALSRAAARLLTGQGAMKISEQVLAAA